MDAEADDARNREKKRAKDEKAQKQGGCTTAEVDGAGREAGQDEQGGQNARHSDRNVEVERG